MGINDIKKVFSLRHDEKPISVATSSTVLTESRKVNETYK